MNLKLIGFLIVYTAVIVITRLHFHGWPLLLIISIICFGLFLGIFTVRFLPHFTKK